MAGEIVNWNPDIGWSVIINVGLVAGALIGLFVRRSKDLITLEEQLRSQRSLTESNTAAISKISDAQASVANAITQLATEQAEIKGIIKMLIQNRTP